MKLTIVLLQRQQAGLRRRLAVQAAGRDPLVRSLASYTVSSSSSSSTSPLHVNDDNNRRNFASWSPLESKLIKNKNQHDATFRKNSILRPIDVISSKKNYSKSTVSNKSSSSAPMTSKVIDDEDDKSNGADLLGIKSLIPQWKLMFNKETLFTDISAGMTVGCVAVPLSLAIALSSGVPAEVGLVTAAVSGVAGGLMGGTTLAVTGPAAAISLLVVSAVSTHGLEALPIITMGCGLLQLASGVTKLGVVAKLCPVSVIAGFTTGVGSLILTNQLPKALGMTAPTGLSPIELLGFIGEHAAQHVNPAAAALAVGTSAAMFLLPKVHPKMPSALIAVGGATVATHALGLDVTLLGNIPSGWDAFQFGVPTLPPMDALPSLAASTFLIYAMTSVESLLSCAALEKMKKTTYKHSPDQELIGQGLSNMTSALFMGMPVTSVIARSSINVRLNATTRLPALVQSGFVVCSVVFMSSTIATIPMPALSGVLITTGLGMLNPSEFKHCYAVQKSDVVPFVATIGGMVSLGLAEGIGIGCMTAVGMSAYKTMQEKMFNEQAYGKAATEPKMMALELTTASSNDDNEKTSSPTVVWQTRVGNQLPTAVDASGVTTMVSKRHEENKQLAFKYDEEMNEFSTKLMDPTKNTVFQLNGPINFLSMFEIDNMIKRMMKQKNKKNSTMDAIVVDMQNVTSLEFTGIEELVNRLVEVSEVEGEENDDLPIHMVNISPAIGNALDQCDPLHKITRLGCHQ
mmetsp:Transcript_39567/g.44291  ORF Transcript_39567/g.44291 Transcript_39567/m.44291 type:complete len:744 (+) Transcript_39567:386-2617(+)